MGRDLFCGALKDFTLLEDALATCRFLNVALSGSCTQGTPNFSAKPRKTRFNHDNFSTGSVFKLAVW